LLTHVLEVTMRLLHPFMPFLSEEIWQRLPRREGADSLCIAQWPAPAHAYGMATDTSDRSVCRAAYTVRRRGEAKGILALSLIRETVSGVT
jgi:valyl-tRNA synthetase